MKVLSAALVLLIIISLFIGIHGYIISELTRELTNICDKTEKLLLNNDWNGISEQLHKAAKKWNSHKSWIALTLNANDIERIETALNHSIYFSKLQAKPDFTGEFISFRLLITKLSLRESIHLNEIL